MVKPIFQPFSVALAVARLLTSIRGIVHWQTYMNPISLMRWAGGTPMLIHGLGFKFMRNQYEISEYPGHHLYGRVAQVT
jgi:hypothetical protein